MIFIEQIVVDKGALYTIEVDSASSGDTVFIDDIAIDFRISADAIPSLASIRIDLDSSPVVMMADVISNDGSVTAVGYIDAMLINGVETFVVFKQDVICKPGEDAPFKIIIAERIAHNTIICKH